MNSTIVSVLHEKSARGADALALLPLGAALVYPFLLDGFHVAIAPAGEGSARTLLALVWLATAFAVPACGFLVFWRVRGMARSLRRLSCLCVAAPTLYVFLGVVNYMAASAWSDKVLWVGMWLGLAAWAWAARGAGTGSGTEPGVGRARVAHGLVAAVVVLYVLFHVFNHFFFVLGPGAHSAVREAGGVIYRAHAVELPLMLLLLFMCASGAYLAWRWSGVDASHDFFRACQVASGVFLLVYIVGHMDSVFIYARLFLGEPTDWQFAVGAPAGLVHDPWNIRLLPHYALAVFLVLVHIASGARGVFLAHGGSVRKANRWWSRAAVASAVAALVIIVGMVRITAG